MIGGGGVFNFKYLTKTIGFWGAEVDDMYL
jgi:hypothetical protein